MLPNIGFGELVVILLIVMLLFGAKRLPEVARGLGKSLQAFKDGMKNTTSEVEDEKKSIPEAKVEAKDKTAIS